MSNQNLLKAILCGNSTVGKTSLLNSLTGSKNFSNTPNPTLGAGCAKVTFNIRNNEERAMNVWDTAGQEAYRSLIRVYFRGTKVAILVFDVSSRPSFEELEKWLGDIHESTASNFVEGGESGCPVLIVANKIDLVENRVISSEEIEKKSRELNRPFVEVSAKTEIGLREMIICAYRMACGEKVPLNPTEEFFNSELAQYENKEKAQTIELTDNQQEKKGCCK